MQVKHKMDYEYEATICIIDTSVNMVHNAPPLGGQNPSKKKKKKKKGKKKKKKKKNQKKKKKKKKKVRAV